ncbi:MAG: RNA methyltransferase [Deltaproteobacteria bacterium]|nr:RNA methyltransferase [Deltaproteobacteria bacterium]
MKTIEINSPKNTTYKRFLRLNNPRDIRKHQRALLSGPKQVREALTEFPEQCVGIILSNRHSDPDFPEIGAIPRYSLSPDLFKQLDGFATKQPVLIVRADPLPHFDGTLKSPGCTLCIPFQDPGNVGAVIRASAAFGVTQIVMLKEAAHPFHPKSIRAAGSSIFRVTFFQGPSISELKHLEIPLILMSTEGKNVARFDFPNHFCLVPGLEGPGIPADLKGTDKISIPMAKGVESLNAAMATGIVLYLWQNRWTHFNTVTRNKEKGRPEDLGKNESCDMRRTSC